MGVFNMCILVNNTSFISSHTSMGEIQPKLILGMKSAKIIKKQPKIIYYLSAPLRLLSSLREFYTNTLCDCQRIGHVGQVASYVALPHQLSHSQFSRSSSSFKESKDIDDLRELIRVMTLKNTVKHRTNTNDQRKLKAIVDNVRSGRSYSVGVGRIGRIDEDVPCDFVEVVDNEKSIYPRCRKLCSPYE